MKKRFSCAIFSILFACFTCMFSIPNTTSADSLYVHKIVSIVCDDSGSMNGHYKWAYANYALQSFCGMLNKEDTLFITYMRDSETRGYQPETIDLSINYIQESIKKIRKHEADGGTPYNAVQIAYDKLKNEHDSNPNTQYWLIIITDGEFSETNSLDQNEKVSFLNEKFEIYTSEAMPNGTYAQLTFMGIGESVVMPNANPNKGIFTYYAANEGEITETMANMADRVSGRTRLGTETLSQVNETTISVSSSIPLLNIVAFSQKSNATLLRSTKSDGKELPIMRHVSILYNSYGFTDLKGELYLVGNSQSVIEAGTYQLEFNQPVDVKNIVILFEPAIEVRLHLSVNGKTHNAYDLTDLHETEQINVSYKIYEMNTDTEILPSLLPSGTAFLVDIQENGSSVAKCTTEAMSIEKFTLHHTETKLTGTVTIAGFNPITSSIRFTPGARVADPVYTIKADTEGDGSGISLNEINKKNAFAVVFTAFCDDKIITDRDAVLALSPTIEITPYGNDGEITVTENGQIRFVPGVVNTATASDRVDVTVTCSLANGIKASIGYTVLIPQYEVAVSFASAARSVRYDEISANKELALVFTVLLDGQQIHDISAVKALLPVITTTPTGNTGDIEYRADGSIVFTPKDVSGIPVGNDSLTVTVTCQLDNGAKAAEQYLVLMSDYAVVPVDGADHICKTTFYENEIGTKFIITKDGRQLPKQEIEGKLSAAVDDKHERLNVRLAIQNDGTILCVPYSDEEIRLNFFTWWGFWFRYLFLLPHGTITVQLDSPWASGDNTIQIIDESILFILLNVALPLFIELAVLAFLVTWVVLIINKPKFAKGAKLYIGTIRYDRNQEGHIIRNMTRTDLTKYNSFSYIWKFKKKPEDISVGNLTICADYGDRIICRIAMPWYRGYVRPKDDTIIIKSPKELDEYLERNRSLAIEEFSVVDSISNEARRCISPSGMRQVRYYVSSDNPCSDKVDDRFVIRNGTIFIYTVE